ncbi:UNKNOWN [Stylonychia lemnae]|uniref:Uncharacterized protein n=1 Tax=Stylonychia lemnae TaxID=5949 RepID=A0A077ZV10_STYLE|nr:UNKNOWN [Stylonychia lemnae]|eukprot:CDW73429.1 UNKNOWN [Stylonychia lemnae]
MRKIIFGAIVSIFIAITQSIQVSKILKNRAQSAWKQEATNKFNWNQTQELKWSVVNAFIDVQTSPDGDVYAIQNITSEFTKPKYFLYMYNTTNNVWNIIDQKFQAKAIRFDRLGTPYYLSPENCVLGPEKQNIFCGVSDFEVTVDKKIIALHDNSINNTLQVDTIDSNYHNVPSTNYQYKALGGYKGLTLYKDEPIFLGKDNRVNQTYNSLCLISISAGIDGSLWGLLCEENVTDYLIVKWQTIEQKWYIIEGAKGKSISAFNEISVAIVNSQGLLSLSSSSATQGSDPEYITTIATSIPTEYLPITSIVSNQPTDLSTTAAPSTVEQSTVAPTSVPHTQVSTNEVPPSNTYTNAPTVAPTSVPTNGPTESPTQTSVSAQPQTSLVEPTVVPSNAPTIVSESTFNTPSQAPTEESTVINSKILSQSKLNYLSTFKDGYLFTDFKKCIESIPENRPSSQQIRNECEGNDIFFIIKRQNTNQAVGKIFAIYIQIFEPSTEISGISFLDVTGHQEFSNTNLIYEFYVENDDLKINAGSIGLDMTVDLSCGYKMETTKIDIWDKERNNLVYQIFNTQLQDGSSSFYEVVTCDIMEAYSSTSSII